MKQWFLEHIQTPQRFLAFAFLLLFPFHTILILSEQFVNGHKWEYGTIGYYGIEILGWLFVASVVVQLLHKVKRTQIQFQWSRDRLFVLSLLLFLLYSIASSLWAIDSSLAMQQSTRLMLAVLVFLSLPMVLTRTEIGKILAIVSVLPVCMGLYQFLSQTLPGSVLLGISGRDVVEPGVSVVQFGNERWLRAYGTFAHPNVFGGYLMVVLASMLLLRDQLSTYWYICISLLAMTLVFTMSRSAWFAVGLFVILQLIRFKQLSKGGILVIISMFVAAVLVYPVTLTRLMGTSAHEYWSFEERSAIQDMSMNLVRQQPLFGTGAGNMTRALIEKDETKFGYAYQPVHNVFILLLIEYGIIGLLLIAGVCYAGVRMFSGNSDMLYALMFLPLLWFDHYLLTSLHGMLLLGIGLSTLVLSEQGTSHSSTNTAVDEV